MNRVQNFHRILLVVVLCMSFSVALVIYGKSNTAGASSTVEVYPGPGTGTYLSNLYKVEVFDGTTWQPSYTYKYSRTSETHWHQGGSPSVHFTTFGTTGPVSVRITNLNGSITSLDVSPKSKNIATQITGNQATMTLNQNNKTWMTINGDDSNPLFVFADALKPSVPQGATYFGPGVHEIAPATGDHYQASDNEIIYLDGGAWVKGNIIATGKTNVRIMGPGVLSGELWDPTTTQQLPWDQFQNYFMVYGGQAGVVNNGTVQGITIVDSPGYNIYSMSGASSVKILSPWSYQTDAFDTISTDQSFAFNGDTTFNLGTAYWSPVTQGYTVNLSVTNSFVGNTNNAVFLGGFWGNPPSATFTVNVDNVDVKTYNNNDWVPFGAPPEPAVFQDWVDSTDSTHGDSNQTYQNIRIEGNIGAPLLQLKNLVYPWGGANANNPPLGNSYNLMFKNISLSGTQNGLSEIKGWDANNEFHNITFNNLTMNGTQVTQSNANSYFDVNNYVTGLAFTVGSSSSSSSTPASSAASSSVTSSASSASSSAPASSSVMSSSSSSSAAPHPTVSITYPANNATVGRKTTVNITANASDPSGISKVEFYVGGSLQCIDTTSPYSCAWPVPAPPSVYSLTAKAYNTANVSTTSSVVTVTAK